MVRLEFASVRRVGKLLAVGVMAFASVGLFGCSACNDEKVTDSGLSIGRRFYMVNDSTIMLDFFYWETVEFYSSYIHGRDEEFRVTDYSAYLVSPYKDTVFREIDYPIYKVPGSMDQVDDGLVFSFLRSDDAYRNLSGDISKAAKWKIAHDGVIATLNVNPGYIDSMDYLVEFRNGQFKDKRILSFHYDGISPGYTYRFFYVWNIAKNSVARWVPTGESAWMSECRDLQWTEEKFRCLEERNEKILVTDENNYVLDSIQTNGCNGVPECFYYSLRFYGNYISDGRQIYKLYDDGQISDEPLFSIYFESYTRGRTVIYQNSGDTIYYSGESIQ